MYPYLIRIGELSIPAYPFLYGLGIALAGGVLMYLGHREGLDVRKLNHLVLLLAFSALIGGRAFYVIHFRHEFVGHWGQAFDLSQGGQVIYGGLLLGTVTILLYSRAARLPVRTVFDLTAVVAPLGIAVGRLACFCRGCCYGRLTKLPWGVCFPVHMSQTGEIVGSPAFLDHAQRGLVSKAALHSLPVHPVQLYSSAMMLVLFGVMLLVWRGGYLRGRLMFVFFGIYAVYRFWIEFLRVEPKVLGQLTAAQVTGVVVLLVSLAVLCAPMVQRWKKAGRT